VATTALFLDGWDEQSIVGTDELTGGWFAQLWRNGSDSERPEVWVNAGTSGALLEHVLRGTGAPMRKVSVAFTEALAELRAHHSPDVT